MDKHGTIFVETPLCKQMCWPTSTTTHSLAIVNTNKKHFFLNLDFPWWWASSHEFGNEKTPRNFAAYWQCRNHTTAQATWAPIVQSVRRLNWFSDNLLELLDRYNFLSRGLCVLSPCVWMKSNLKDYPLGQCEIYNKVYRRYTLYLLIWWVMMGSNVSIMGGRECSIITLSKSDPGQNNNNVV